MKRVMFFKSIEMFTVAPSVNSGATHFGIKSVRLVICFVLGTRIIHSTECMDSIK